MKKSWIDMVQDYVDARLAVGGCAMVVIGVFAAIYFIPIIIRNLVEDIKMTWMVWMPLVLLVVVTIMAMTAQAKAKKAGGKIAAFILWGSILPQIGMLVANICMASGSEIGYEWLGVGLGVIAIVGLIKIGTTAYSEQ